MNIKPVTVTLMILLASAATSPASAQNAGVRIGAAQTQNPTVPFVSPNPVQGMTTPPIQPMTTPPIMPMGSMIAPTPAGANYGNNNFTILNPGQTIFVPAGTLIMENSLGLQTGSILTAPAGSPTATSSTYSGPLATVPLIPSVPSPVSSSPAISTGPQGARGGRGGGASQKPGSTSSSAPAASNISAASANAARLDVGTPQDKVIEKYGNPVAYLMGMNGQTLYFNSGVVVFIRNGVVATPGN